MFARLHGYDRERLWHFVKFGSVGLSGTALNASLFALATLVLAPETASPLVFVVCGQYAFFMHAFMTWRTARNRKLRAAWLLFIIGNWSAAAINYVAFAALTSLGLWTVACYLLALFASVPLTYCYNAVVVFPLETMPKERVLRAWQKLVEWNG